MLEDGLLLSDLVSVAKGLVAGVLLVLLHIRNDVVHFATTWLMTSCQSFVGVVQSRVSSVDTLQVGEIILVGGLHIFQEVLESLKFINFPLDAIVLLRQRLELLVCLLYLSVFFFDFLCKTI